MSDSRQGRIDAGWRAPRTISWLASFAVSGSLLLAWIVGKSPPAWYPDCVFHLATHLHCPGCGTARAVHAALHGEWGAAAGHNALLVALIPCMGIWAVNAWWRGVRHNRAPLAPPVGSAGVALWLVVGFAVARNLPWPPFHWLAPGP
ncbi:MAG TPA: DUF2752 domain-containing protein [Opitutaceae bacterium]